jgi:hypothetical protein
MLPYSYSLITFVSVSTIANANMKRLIFTNELRKQQAYVFFEVQFGPTEGKFVAFHVAHKAVLPWETCHGDKPRQAHCLLEDRYIRVDDSLLKLPVKRHYAATPQTASHITQKLYFTQSSVRYLTLLLIDQSFNMTFIVCCCDPHASFHVIIPDPWPRARVT